MQRNRSRATDAHCYYVSEQRQHRGLSVSPRQNKPTEAKVWKKTSTRVSLQTKWSLRFFSFYVSLFCSLRGRDGRDVLTCCRAATKTTQTFLLMKSNLVSHCIHLGHWKTREDEKQDVTQRAELGGFERSSSSKSGLTDTSFYFLIL